MARKNLSDYDKALYGGTLHRAWRSLKNRCQNPKNAAFNNYGGRGITVCDKWQTFAGFLEDMEPSHQTGLSIDRIDNGKGYCKENCRWVEKREQANNRRTNRLITIHGVTKTLAQWIAVSGVKPSTARQRFYGYKWPIEKALGLEVHFG